MYRIGCDVGGTNTDAAIIDVLRVDEASRGVLATAKTTTTPDVTHGITTAIQQVLVQSGIDRTAVLNVAIGTTHFVNAVVERDARHLQRVAVIRLCGPYTRKNPPFSDFPYALRDVVEGPVFYLDGGLEVDGREISSIDPAQVIKAAKAIVEASIRAVAIVGVFSALDHDGSHEERCRRIILDAYPNLSVVCSHTIGGPGFLVRENATILNATITALARTTIRGFRQAISELDLVCPLFLTQNDGTLIKASAAALLPVKTFASGPTNSLMGAAFLQNVSSANSDGEKQLLIVDVGGTTTDVCALLPSGFPRKAPSFVEVGGVRTAFSMPEVQSVGLGGGSRVRTSADGSVRVGPDSVAYRLTSDAKVFGGNTLTTTDIAVASGRGVIGDQSLVVNLPTSTLSGATQETRRILENVVDKMKVSQDPAVVILVGGGSFIVPEELDGVIQCLRPPHHDSANAVGAAIAGVSGEIDTIVVLEGKDEANVIEQIKSDAVAAAVKNGADQATVKITELNKIPLQYVSNKATRFTAKAVGYLDSKASLSTGEIDQSITEHEQTDTDLQQAECVSSPSSSVPGKLSNPSLDVDLVHYRPDVRDGVWYISPIDIELIASGCGVLGTGGGGSPYDTALHIQEILRSGGQGSIRVIPPGSLKDTDVCVFGSGYGAPSVSDERLASGDEVFTAVEELNKTLNIKNFDAIVADEIGGGNGLITFPTSARFDKPVVDCDLMGRAYPTAEHLTPCVFGEPLTPCSMADCNGNVGIVAKAKDNRMVEAMLRTQCIVLGNSAAVASRPLSGAKIKEYSVPNTVSQAWFLGRAVHLARKTKSNIVEALANVMPVKLLYTGKVVDVTRDVSRGYTVGQCVIGPLSVEERDEAGQHQFESKTLVVPFQNEYLAAYLVENDLQNPGPMNIQDEDVICTVPDLISILGQDGEALGSPELRYGLQVQVIGVPAHPIWTQTAEGMRIGGPEFFQLGMAWKSIGDYKLPRSVFDEFGG